MILSEKKDQKSYVNWLVWCSIIGLIVFGTACDTEQQQIPNIRTVAAIEPTKMNVLYLGVDNPMAIAVSGYEAKDLRVELDSMGVISGENGIYNIRPLHPGILKVFVYAKKDLVAEKHFRVKTLPHPVVKIAGKTGGDISREELLKAKKIDIVLENFDFDLSFEIIEFTVSTVIDGYVIEHTSISEMFTHQQIQIIEKLKPGQHLYFQDIKAQGPDGAKRTLPTVYFKIE